MKISVKTVQKIARVSTGSGVCHLFCTKHPYSWKGHWNCVVFYRSRGIWVHLTAQLRGTDSFTKRGVLGVQLCRKSGLESVWNIYDYFSVTVSTMQIIGRAQSDCWALLQFPPRCRSPAGLWHSAVVCWETGRCITSCSMYAGRTHVTWAEELQYCFYWRKYWYWFLADSGSAYPAGCVCVCVCVTLVYSS